MGDFLTWLLSLTDQIEDWILVIGDAWWVHLVVLAFAALDGFFPTVPSESTIVSLSSLWSSSGRPSILLIGLAAWMGAWAGDSLGYLIGRKIGWQRFKFLREGKGRRAVEAAERGLQRRALLFLMTARYIPFGRTALNLVAGAVRYPHHHFWPRSLLSTFVWAVYSCLIGAVAGAWFEDNHLLAITVALVAAVVLALIAERAINALHRMLDRRLDLRAAAEADDEDQTDRSAHTGHAAHADRAAHDDRVDPADPVVHEDHEILMDDEDQQPAATGLAADLSGSETVSPQTPRPVSEAVSSMADDEPSVMTRSMARKDLNA